MLKYLIKLSLIALLLFFFSQPFLVPAQASTTPNLKDAFSNQENTAFNLISGASYNKNIVLETLAGQIITLIFSLLGIIFILFTIYGGYLYLTARGNEEQTKKAKSIITQNIIGIVIILGAYALVYFIIKFFI